MLAVPRTLGLIQSPYPPAPDGLRDRDPSALAVLMFTTNSNFVGCSTGRSPGFAPLSILSTYQAARRLSADGRHVTQQGTRLSRLALSPYARPTVCRRELEDPLPLGHE
jgi:hypothetical protein